MIDLLNYIKEHENDIDSILMSVNYLNPHNTSIKDTLATSINWEYNYYLSTHNLNYLYTGLLIIEAYLRLGFPYEFGREHFDKVLTALGTDENSLFPRTRYFPAIKLNKSQINSVFGRWYPMPNGLKKPDMINEIINNVTNRKKGIYTYKSNHGHIIELVITDTECYLHDIQRGIFYSFIKDSSKPYLRDGMLPPYTIY